MFNIVQRRKWFFLFSGLLIVAGLIAMGISISTYPEHSPVRLSVDFLGGSLFELQFAPTAGTKVTGAVTEDMITNVFRDFGLKDIRIQRLGEPDATGNSGWQVRTNFITNETTDKIKTALNDMAKSIGLQLDTTKSRSNQVSPTVGSEVTNAALIAVIVASLAVLGWIALAFRGVSGAFRYGVCAVIAMIHDILIMVGIMSIMGLLAGWEADALFLTGLLTVVEMIINRSIMETIQRSLALQLVVAFVLVSLFLMGGASIHQFVGVLLIGLLSGTYSSTFVAIPLLVAWDEGQLPFINRKRSAAAGA
jgi:preprotein translocase subunit SecF